MHITVTVGKLPLNDDGLKSMACGTVFLISLHFIDTILPCRLFRSGYLGYKSMACDTVFLIYLHFLDTILPCRLLRSGYLCIPNTDTGFPTKDKTVKKTFRGVYLYPWFT